MNRIFPYIGKLLFFYSSSAVLLALSAPILALPPPEDTPEEVLRTEIITGARSPIDGKPVSAAEYAQLSASLREPQFQRPQVDPEVQHLIFLLRLSYPLRKLFPFLHF
ncbi:hypothetical protein H6S82_12470 [Planktothrix sp. FACHB-1355]|uniref:Glutathione S-transferase n=1 Tax=Aerosakkonema funiforme FACHB-1375 TaxID=2949571 RepID=A0A926VIJ2_9CYAN|nr:MULTISPECIES: hypothetical protein [Oscillatoriales]MBD2184540.1 hypothetical protein [Aerosakkonema funiforme FACHB-1375]MBD3559672.1 hypothetical protein [Planktothrix sp. FACHB-1355]